MLNLARRRPLFGHVTISVVIRSASLVTILVVAGCADSSGRTPSGPSPATETTATSTLTPAQVAESREFRETYGIRADDRWISIVSADPSSQEGVDMFGVPLLPWELDNLLARNSAAVEVGQVVAEYGMTVPEDWHGSYIDPSAGSTVVVEVYRNVDVHRAALGRLLSPAALWEVREVAPRILEQIAFVERVRSEEGWFDTVDARLLHVGTNSMDGGIVELTYISMRRDLDVEIRAHFAAPEWVRIDWAGEPPWDGPVGDLVILAVDGQGRPVPGLMCAPGDGDGVGLVTAPDGSCRYPGAPARETRVRLIGGIDSEGHTYVAGEATFLVVANDLTVIRIRVETP